MKAGGPCAGAVRAGRRIARGRRPLAAIARPCHLGRSCCSAPRRFDPSRTAYDDAGHRGPGPEQQHHGPGRSGADLARQLASWPTWQRRVLALLRRRANNMDKGSDLQRGAGGAETYGYGT